MKELLVLRRGRKTHLLAGNIGMSYCLLIAGGAGALEMKEPPSLV